ncbi:SDR family NAD(P)-dependent oxidoreductase [Flavobacterium subsaxonicum]|uniref:SDR family NAD(P)-dependent oxidoreductase n=1 Tax=Flavobacterium subsaxonicum TaxID=426226 RepID=UPI00040DFEA0|nr:SDR family NAD(P)-dependent oxidoreductase [Flavobacterium subsaxonicum]
MEQFILKNRNALITGGSKGIGKATVELFLKLDANVLFTARNEKLIEEVVTELQKDFSNIEGIAADVTVVEDVVRLKSLIEEKWGQLDVLVNNAGTNIRKPTVDYTETEYQQVIDTNITSVFRLNNAMYPLLKKGTNTSIINSSC